MIAGTSSLTGMTLMQILSAAICVAMFHAGCNRDTKAECRYNSDCGQDLVCSDKKCVSPLFFDSSSEGMVSDSDSDNNRDTVVPIEDDSATAPGDTDSNEGATDNTHEDTGSGDLEDRTGCLSNAECDDRNPCTQDYCNFDVQPTRCEASPTPNGVSCDDGNPCNGKDVCQSGTCTHQDPPCGGTTPSGDCTVYVGACDPTAAEMCSYATQLAPDGTPCTTTDACFQGICRQGQCTQMTNPCSETDLPCMNGVCTPTGKGVGEYKCDALILAERQFCRVTSEADPCAASLENPDFADGTCQMTAGGPQCIIGDERICYDSAQPSICSAQVCMPTDGSCMDVPEADVSRLVECDSTVVIDATQFVTREYPDYPPPCNPIEAEGMEIALKLNLTHASNVTVNVISDTERVVSLHHLTDMCDPSSCMTNAYDTLSVSPMQPTDAIIVEAGMRIPPSGIELEVNCD